MGNRCLAGSDTPTGRGEAVGAACQAAAECDQGLCLSDTTMPGGYCSKTCGGNLLTEDPDCPGGASCFQMNEATSVCLDLCGAADGDCRSGYRCQTVGPSRICIPSCKSDADCVDDEACNVGTGECQMGRPRAPGPVGGGCTNDSECASGQCLPDDPTARPRFPGGYCFQACTPAEENKPCGQGGICVGTRRADGSLIGYLCLGACRTGVDCRDEYLCSADVDVQIAAGVGMCLPRCEHFDCKGGETCDTAVGMCTAGGPTAGDSSVTYQDLGTFPVGYTEAQAKTLEFQVAPETISFAIVGEADTPTLVDLLKIVAPNGQTVFDPSDLSATGFRWGSYGESNGTAVLFPNAPRVTLLPGKYQMTWATGNLTRMKFSLLQKRQSGVVQRSSLPLRFMFTRNKYLSAQTAPSDPRFQQALKTLTDVYQESGINVGPISYVDLTGPQAQSLAVVEGDDELNQLFAVASSSDEPALHFLMVEQLLLGSEGFNVLGVSDGIPGPPPYPGVFHSGVAVALGFIDSPDGLARLGSTMSHEAGHHLGLFHTTERAGTSHDPLMDTLECPASADTDGGGFVSYEECVGKGSDNLMFWTSSRNPGQNARNKLTNDQRFVLMRNPTLR